MKTFVVWLAASSLSQVIQANLWVIPFIQSIHILALAVLMGSALLSLLRVFGRADVSKPTFETIRSHLNRMWVALVVMAISGSLLVIGEPDRSLRNSAFWSKMALIAMAVVTAEILARGLRHNRNAPTGGSMPKSTRGLALAGFALWCAVLTAGRWIAYVDVD